MFIPFRINAKCIDTLRARGEREKRTKANHLNGSFSSVFEGEIIIELKLKTRRTKG